MPRNQASDELTSFPLVLGPKPKGRRNTSPAVDPSRAPLPPPVSVPSGIAKAREAAMRSKTSDGSQAVGSNVFERAAAVSSEASAASAMPVAPVATPPVYRDIAEEPKGGEETHTDLSLPKVPPPKMTVFGAQAAQPATRQESYRLGKVLGRGGLSTVYEATKEGADNFRKRFAIKRIHEHLAKDAALLDLLADEARLLSQIQHPNVCQVLDFVQDEAGAFMVLELLDGCTLLQLFRTLRQHPEQLAAPNHQFLVARIIAAAADGLHAAHELKDERGESLEVVHRDVTPHNLFVLSSGAVKVADFGIARARNQVHHTAAGMVKGKLSYMAPEQLHGLGVDRRSDVFALGAVMWEMLTGDRLFHRATEAETLAAICNGEIPEPKTRQASITPAISDVVMKALRLDPSERFQNAREMARALERAIAKSGVAVANSDVADWVTDLAPTGNGERATVRSALPLPTSGVALPKPEVAHVVEVVDASRRHVATIATGKRPWFSRVLLPAAIILPCLALGAALLKPRAHAPTAAPPPHVAHAIAPKPTPAAPPPVATAAAKPAAEPAIGEATGASEPAAHESARPAPSASPVVSLPAPIKAATHAAPVAPSAPAKPAASETLGRGSVVVSVSGAPADVVIEGRTYPSGQTISLPVGPHRITVVRKADSRPSHEIEVNVKEGGTAFIPLTVAPVPTSPTP